MIAFLTWVSIIAVWYAYFGYPLALMLFNGHYGREPIRPRDAEQAAPKFPTRPKKLTVIIAARNEEAKIETKLQNTLSLTYAGIPVPNEHCEVIVASDASSDQTHEFVEQFADRGVKLVALTERGGKETAQGAAVKASTGDLILFTDAKVLLNDGALDNAASYFDDFTIGAISSTDQVISLDGEGSGEGFYVRYEMWLRELESAFGSVVGLSGSCFVARRQLCSNWRTDIPSDFAVLIETQRQGLRGVLVPDVIGSYTTVASESEEYARKVRTVLRGLATFFRCLDVAHPMQHGAFAWQMLSHKLGRWLVPWFFLVATLGSIALAGSAAVYTWLFLGFALFYALAGLGLAKPEWQKFLPIKVPLFFLISNAAIASAWVRYIKGERSVAWDPSAKV